MTLIRSVFLVLLFTVPVLAQDTNETRQYGLYYSCD